MVIFISTCAHFIFELIICIFYHFLRQFVGGDLILRFFLWINDLPLEWWFSVKATITRPCYKCLSFPFLITCLGLFWDKNKNSKLSIPSIRPSLSKLLSSGCFLLFLFYPVLFSPCSLSDWYAFSCPSRGQYG